MSSRRRKSNRRGKKAVSPVQFWGDPDATFDEPAPIEIAEDPTAMVRSLGPAPLPGREQVAEHYFAAVYERAAALGGALAAAADLLDTADED
jgi:hypothetical protein